MTPEQRWDDPIQDAIREHDKAPGHVPIPSAVAEADWFKRFPNGGTVFLDPMVDVHLPALREEEV
jgi:hypothetical protein